MELNEIIANNQIALYGLSTETERILMEWDGKYNVIGLLDGFETSGEKYGYPILEINDVVNLDNVVIIVVARPGSCKAITKRIGDLCRNHNIPLFDIRGKDLLVENKVAYDFKSIKGYTKSEIIEQIKSVTCVSFDLFDTLIVRKVLNSSDVIELLAKRLEEKGIYIPQFVSKRIRAEKLLSRGKAPRLTYIHNEILKDISTISINADKLAELEFHLECELVFPRDEVVDLVSIARELGKKVYITSDSYYSKSQIQYILEKNNIHGYDDILVSCEYGIGKVDGLFDKLIEIAGTSDILHIGDDIVADIESATRYGIKSFQIYSSDDLLNAVGGLGLSDYMNNFSDRIRIGLFISRIFNSPFVFENEDKIIEIKNKEDIGYLIFAPMISDFVIWFKEQIETNNIPNVWLSARDGYLIDKLLKMMHINFDVEYFLASRTAVIRAGVENAEDIRYVDNMKYSGTLEDNLKSRFGIDAKSISSSDIDVNTEGLAKFEKAILKNAEIARGNYQKYIDKLSVKDGDVAFFDFVAKGTTQLYLNKIVENHLRGFYFLQLERDNMKDKNIDIVSFYSENEKDTSSIFENYYILETILTAPHSSVHGFDVEGNPIYAQETRSIKDIQCVEKIQKGILSYYKDYTCLCPENEVEIDKKMDEIFLSMIHAITIKDEDFLSLVVEDPFFNRMTNITDVI